MIDITGADLATVIREAYALSKPQGLGYLHYKDGPLPQPELEAIVARHAESRDLAASMDYVMGRAVKLVVFRKGDKLEIRDEWFDHSPDQLAELLKRIGKP